MFSKLLTFALVSGVFQVVEPALIRAPQNTAVTRGSEVTFKCTSDAATNKSFITWFNTLCETYTVSRDCTRVYNGYNTLDTPPRHTVTSVNNSTHVTRDLSISETKLTDAGVFVCVENIPGHGVQQISSAQLIVVANNPQCSWNLSSSGAVQQYDVITLTCSITYSGNWAPVMRWFNSVTRHNYSGDVTNSSTNDMTTVTSQLTVVASRGLNKSKIVCVTYFTEPSTSPPTNTTNIPSYTYTWTSPTVNVIPKFAPRNLQITPRRSTYQPGDRIQCSADGNPEPSYQWTDLVSGTVIQGYFLVISEDMVNDSYEFRCTASNYFNRTLHNESTTLNCSVLPSPSSTVPSPATDNDVGLIAGAIVAVCVAVLIIVIIVIVVCRKRKSTSQTSQGEQRRRNNQYVYSNEASASTSSIQETNVDRPAQTNLYQNADSVIYTSLERPGRRPVVAVPDPESETMYAEVLSA